MFLKYDSKNIPLARQLRKNATPQEKRLWYDFLSKYKLAKFQRQKAIDHFIADFYCHKANLIIEVDGSQHHTPAGEAKDALRTEILEGYGLTVIRIPNYAIDNDFRRVCDFIDDFIKQAITIIPANGG